MRWPIYSRVALLIPLIACGHRPPVAAPDAGSPAPVASTAGGAADGGVEAATAVDPEVVRKAFETLYGVDGVKLIETAGSVEVFRLDPVHPGVGGRRIPLDGGFAGYEIIRKAPPLPKDRQSALERFLLDPATFDLARNQEILSNKLCGGFQPGIGFRLIAGANSPKSIDHLDVLLCFVCADVGVVYAQAQNHNGHLLGFTDGQILTADMSHARHRLLELSNQALGGDPDFETLLDHDNRRLAERDAIDSRLPPKLVAAIRHHGWALEDMNAERPPTDIETLRGAVFGIPKTELLKSYCYALAEAGPVEGVPTEKMRLALWAIEPVTGAELAAAFDQLKDDPHALVGAGLLYFDLRMRHRFSEADAAHWTPILAYSMFRDAPVVNPYGVLNAVAADPSPEGRVFLELVADGKLEPRVHRREDGLPTPAEHARKLLAGLRRRDRTGSTGTDGGAEFGQVCLDTVAPPTSGPKSLGNATGGNHIKRYEVEIDDSPRVRALPWLSQAFPPLPLAGTHRVVIWGDGKKVESFSFTFHERRSSELCLEFKPLYETWMLRPMSEAMKTCRCADLGANSQSHP